jgi:hypothetical protein
MTKSTKTAVSGDLNAAILSERLRVSAILESPEGRRNVPMAQELALRSSLDVDTARAILGKASASNPYLDAANRQCPINLGGDGIGSNVESFVNDPRAARLKEIEVSVKAFNDSNNGTTRRAPRARG